MLKAIEATSNLTYDKINDIIAAKDAIMQVISDDTSIIRPDSLVNALFTQPFTKVKHLQDAGIYAEKTARNYLNTLTDMGILSRRTLRGRIITLTWNYTGYYQSSEKHLLDENLQSLQSSHQQS